MSAFKLALAQMPVIGGQRDENLRCAVEFIDIELTASIRGDGCA